MSVHVIRAFVQMRRMLAAHKELTRQLSELEGRIGRHDEQIQVIIEAIQQLMAPPMPKHRRIGFLVSEKAAKYRHSFRS